MFVRLLNLFRMSPKLRQALDALDAATNELIAAIEKLEASMSKAIDKWAADINGVTPLGTLKEKFPVLEAGVRWPCDCYDFMDGAYGMLSNCIMHLNDKHHWTRQQIADWLEACDIDITVVGNG